MATEGPQPVGLKPVIALSPAMTVTFIPGLLISGGRDVAATVARLSRERFRDIQEWFLLDPAELRQPAVIGDSFPAFAAPAIPRAHR
jgi:hypothetical protein